MSDPPMKPRSGNLNAPQIPYELYVMERTNFVGAPIGSIVYGIIVVLFFRCISALLDPVNRTRKGTKWLIAHTVAMFSCATISSSLSIALQSISYIDNRNFLGIDGEFPPGPFGYGISSYYNVIIVIPNAMTFLNQWLADGLLLYRCYIIYGMDYWVISFPCLLYLASFALGIVSIYGNIVPGFFLSDVFGLSCFSISVGLNVLLTLMIVIRLIVHSRNFRKAVGASTMPAGELYNFLVTTIIESFALSAVAYLVFIGSWRTRNLSNIIGPVLFGAQVVAPFLIILRVADRRALKSETTPPGNFGSICFRGRGGSTSDNTTMFDENMANSVETNGGVPTEHGADVLRAVEEVPL